MTEQKQSKAMKKDKCDNPAEDPSCDRRQALLKRVNDTNRVLDTSHPIMRYYDVAKTLLDYHNRAVEINDLDSAFVAGKRFTTLCLELLPGHVDYLDQLYEIERVQYTKEANRVMDYLEIVKESMDVEERAKQEKNRRKSARKKRAGRATKKLR
jgi:USP8 dimerisation domain